MCKQILIVLSILIAFGCADDPQNQQASCGERLPEEEKQRSASIPDNATTPGENESASDVDEIEPSHISYRITEFKAYDTRHLRGGTLEPDNITHIQANNSGWSQNSGRFFIDFGFYHRFDLAYSQSCTYETDTPSKYAWRFNVTLESEPDLPFKISNSACSYRDWEPIGPDNPISYSSIYYLDNYQTHIPSDTEVTLYIRIWDKACSEHGCSSIDNGSFIRGTSNTAEYKITFLHELTDPE